MKTGLLFFCFIIVNSLFAQDSLTVDQIDTTWWYENYSKGFEYLDRNSLEAAEKEFWEILEKDDNNAQAYYGLGRVYSGREEGKSDAIDYFEEAIDRNPDLLDAYYYQGLLYEQKGIWSRASAVDCFETINEKNPHYINAWIALARIWETLRWPWEPTFNTLPAEILAKAIEFNPDNKLLYEEYKKFIYWHSLEDMSIPTFEFLIKQNPTTSNYSMDFAQTLYNLDEFESALTTMDSIEILYSNYSPFRINNLRAKICFNTENEDSGLVHYWQALDTIRDSLDVNEIYSDLYYIMNDREFEDYQTTSMSDLPDFYSRFWSSRDPNLATIKNERIVEHYKRLKVAWNEYRRYIPGDYNKVIIYKMDHPFFGKFNVKFGDELSDPFVSQALPEKRNIDDMGLIFIRHGEPDNFAFSNCMSCPQNISWKYFANYSRSELIFHFSKHSDMRGWYLETLPYTFINRGDFGGDYARFDPTYSPNQDFILNMPRYNDLNDHNIENVKTGLKTETSEYDYQNTLINFPMESLFFKGENSKTEIYLFYGIEDAKLELDIKEERNYLSYSTFVGFFDETWNEIVRFKNDKYFSLNIDEDDWEESSIVELESLSVLPGNYNCEFQLQDNVSDNLGVYKGPLTVPDYWTNELMLSDIILSGPVSRINEQTYFKKGDIVFNPHMFSAYGEDETVGIYFEIYNLLYDFADRTNFEITWLLKEADTDDTDPEAIRSSLPYSGNSRDDTIYINLELADTDSGDYELVLLVKDMISKVEVSKKARLTIL